MIAPIDFLILCLAAAHSIEVWHHGAIFRNYRDAAANCRFEFVAYLLQCMFCLSLWVAAILCLLYALPVVARFVILPLAVARGANLLNDVFYQFNRTPKESDNEPFEILDTGEQDADIRVPDARP